MKSSLLKKLAAGAALITALSHAAPARADVTNTFNFSVGAAVPDGDLAGLSDTRAFSSPITNISDIQVSLDLSGDVGGGYNGDLYVYLQHDSGFSILLNRVGKTSGNPLGYGDNGFQITLSDTAGTNDIHLYQNIYNPAGGSLTGTWQPDGRNLHPDNVLDTDPRTALLSSFQGLNTTGNWTLFLVDDSTVNQFILNSWGLRLVGAVPEPGTNALLALAAATLLFRLRRQT